MLTMSQLGAVIFVGHTVFLGVEERVHLFGSEPFSLIRVAFFSPQLHSLEAKMVVSWASEQSRGLVIGVVAINYKFFHSS